jgi:hypothetical protein
MMTVVKQAPNGEIVGWMMGADMHDLRRRAEATFDHALAERFYQMEFVPQPGKHTLWQGVTLLVE